MDLSDVSLSPTMPEVDNVPDEAPLTLGVAIDYVQSLKVDRRRVEETLAELSKQIDAAEARVIELMDKQGVTGSVGTLARASIRSSVKPSVTDWDAFYKFIHTNQYYHLLERRPSASGCREIFERDGQLPGVVPFTKRSLHITTL